MHMNKFVTKLVHWSYYVSNSYEGNLGRDTNVTNVLRGFPRSLLDKYLESISGLERFLSYHFQIIINYQSKI
jgi:hypothetical protein